MIFDIFMDTQAQCDGTIWRADGVCRIKGAPPRPRFLDLSRVRKQLDRSHHLASRRRRARFVRRTASAAFRGRHRAPAIRSFYVFVDNWTVRIIWRLVGAELLDVAYQHMLGELGSGGATAPRLLCTVQGVACHALCTSQYWLRTCTRTRRMRRLRTYRQHQ